MSTERISAIDVASGNLVPMSSNPPVSSSALSGWNGIQVEQHRIPASESPELELQHYSKITPARGVRAPQIQYIGLALLAELETGCLSGRLYGESLATALAVHLVKRYSTSRKPIREPAAGFSKRQLQQVIDYINGNLASRMTLIEIAAVAGTSPYYLARQFKLSTGLPPHQYVIRCRIEQAKILLTENKWPIVEIGYRIGCSSQSNFTALFGKHVGMTPKDYREQTKK